MTLRTFAHGVNSPSLSIGLLGYQETLSGHALLDSVGGVTAPGTVIFPVLTAPTYTGGLVELRALHPGVAEVRDAFVLDGVAPVSSEDPYLQVSVDSSPQLAHGRLYVLGVNRPVFDDHTSTSAAPFTVDYVRAAGAENWVLLGTTTVAQTLPADDDFPERQVRTHTLAPVVVGNEVDPGVGTRHRSVSDLQFEGSDLVFYTARCITERTASEPLTQVYRWVVGPNGATPSPVGAVIEAPEGFDSEAHSDVPSLFAGENNRRAIWPFYSYDRYYHADDLSQVDRVNPSSQGFPRTAGHVNMVDRVSSNGTVLWVSLATVISRGSEYSNLGNMLEAHVAQLFVGNDILGGLLVSGDFTRYTQAQSGSLVTHPTLFITRPDGTLLYEKSLKADAGTAIERASAYGNGFHSDIDGVPRQPELLIGTATMNSIGPSRLVDGAWQPLPPLGFDYPLVGVAQVLKTGPLAYGDSLVIPGQLVGSARAGRRNGSRATLYSNHPVLLRLNDDLSLSLLWRSPHAGAQWDGWGLEPTTGRAVLMEAGASNTGGRVLHDLVLNPDPAVAPPLGLVSLPASPGILYDGQGATETSHHLSWPYASGARSFQVYRNAQLIGTVPADDPSDGLPNDTAQGRVYEDDPGVAGGYWYAVAGIGADGRRGPAVYSPDTPEQYKLAADNQQLLPTPTGFFAQQANDDDGTPLDLVYLFWNGPAGPTTVTGWLIYRDGLVIASPTPQDGTFYQDERTPGTYSYSIAAIGPSGNSAQTSPVVVTVS